jgi:hypothetical protein
MDETFLNDFRQTLDAARARLLTRSDEEAGRARAAGTWSAKEIIGHLIDSAANNHVRFVRAQATDDLMFDGYDQDAWVRVQQYRERPWRELVDLWFLYNRHLAVVMASASREALDRPRARHTLDRIAFQPVAPEAPATLDGFMRDYVAHMKHHLRQILGTA